jgi:hypothetical protein
LSFASAFTSDWRREGLRGAPRHHQARHLEFAEGIVAHADMGAASHWPAFKTALLTQMEIGRASVVVNLCRQNGPISEQWVKAAD